MMQAPTSHLKANKGSMYITANMINVDLLTHRLINLTYYKQEHN